MLDVYVIINFIRGLFLSVDHRMFAKYVRTSSFSLCLREDAFLLYYSLSVAFTLFIVQQLFVQLTWIAAIRTRILFVFFFFSSLYDHIFTIRCILWQLFSSANLLLLFLQERGRISEE